MAIEVKRRMLQREYAWEATAGDDPLARKIDARLFNRHEGYEVIPMIQKVVDHFGSEDESDVSKVEALITHDLPGTVRGRRRVFDWLVERLEGERAAEAAEKEEAARKAAGEEAAREAAEEEAARKAAEEEAARKAEQEEAARKAAAEEAVRKAAARRAAALEAKWQVPETWKFSYDEMRKKVAVYAAFEQIARHLVGACESTELPATFAVDREQLAEGSCDPSVEIRITRYNCDQPPVGTYHGRLDFATAAAGNKASFRLDLEHTGDGVTGTSSPAA